MEDAESVRARRDHARLGTSEASCSSQVAGQPSSDGGRQGRSTILDISVTKAAVRSMATHTVR